jgi:hypothetical protein
MKTYWRPSAVGELILSLGLMFGSVFADGMSWWARSLVFVVGFVSLMALKGHESSITQGKR